MNPWMLLDKARAPKKGEELRLYQRGAEFSIRVDQYELMNSRVHGSEDALGELSCSRIKDRPEPLVLIGGLGMGYTLAATLRGLCSEGRVAVAELVPAVVAWNRGPLGELAGHPLDDPRVTVYEVDVAQMMRAKQGAYDAILLDVDNGPEGLTRKGNDWLYGLNGLSVAFMALRPRGVLAVWSAGPDRAFTQRLNKIGFTVEEVCVRAHGDHGGPRHTLWMATRSD